MIGGNALERGSRRLINAAVGKAVCNGLLQSLLDSLGYTSKRQIGHRFISWRYPLGRPTVLREKNAMQALQRLGVQVSKLVFYAAEKRSKDWHALFSEKARRRWPAHRAALHDLKQFARHRGQMPDTDWQLFLQYYCNLNPKLRTKFA